MKFNSRNFLILLYSIGKSRSIVSFLEVIDASPSSVWPTNKQFRNPPLCLKTRTNIIKYRSNSIISRNFLWRWTIVVIDCLHKRSPLKAGWESFLWFSRFKHFFASQRTLRKIISIVEKRERHVRSFFPKKENESENNRVDESRVILRTYNKRIILNFFFQNKFHSDEIKKQTPPENLWNIVVYSWTFKDEVTLNKIIK